MYGNINSYTILKFLNHFDLIGYDLINVPMFVDEAVSLHTSPFNNVRHKYHYDKVYVASAEQSFIQMFNDNNIDCGKYCAITPCYRPYDINKCSSEIFLKIELIDINSDSSYMEILHDVKNFIEKEYYGNLDIIKTNDGHDLYLNNIEIGSYGCRYMMDNYTMYNYGTGLAEPRFSYARTLE